MIGVLQWAMVDAPSFCELPYWQSQCTGGSFAHAQTVTPVSGYEEGDERRRRRTAMTAKMLRTGALCPESVTTSSLAPARFYGAL